MFLFLLGSLFAVVVVSVYELRKFGYRGDEVWGRPTNLVSVVYFRLESLRYKWVTRNRPITREVVDLSKPITTLQPLDATFLDTSNDDMLSNPYPYTTSVWCAGSSIYGNAGTWECATSPTAKEEDDV